VRWGWGGEQVALLSVCAGKGDAVDKLYLRTVVRSSSLTWIFFLRGSMFVSIGVNLSRLYSSSGKNTSKRTMFK
jgi:hypothetical protein